MHLLVTGGAGYIGSHTCVQLLEAGHEVTVVDNLVNSHPTALERVRSLAPGTLTFIEADIRQTISMERILSSNPVDAVIHFAGLKAVGESTSQPLNYYDNNVVGTISLLTAMAEAGVSNLIFSSSATVYGDPDSVPIQEGAALRATNPYGRSKLMIEEMLMDLAKAEPQWSITLLRYFNPVGAHPSGQIGEDPAGIPNNLMPYISQVAIGKLQRLRIFGDDYSTPDGTGVRDYIHVVDLAAGHLAALDTHLNDPGCHVYNLGTGQGISVLEMRAAFAEACGGEIPFEIVARRPGDIAACWADPQKAERILGWRASLTVEDMTRDAWRWQSQNPNGYGR